MISRYTCSTNYVFLKNFGEIPLLGKLRKLPQISTIYCHAQHDLILAEHLKY